MRLLTRIQISLLARILFCGQEWSEYMEERQNPSPVLRLSHYPTFKCIGSISIGPTVLRIYKDIPSVKLLIASLRCGCCARNLSVTSGSPSRIMRWTIMRALKTIVHVESRNLFVRALKISATPASPAWVAIRICSTYLDLGAAS